MNSRDFQISALPGYTNQNFHLKNNRDDWVLRIPKQETNQYINRRFEAYNAGVAAHLNIAPDCAWRDDSGLSLSVTLNNTRTMTAADLDNESIAGALMKILKRLHGSGGRFQGRVDLPGLLNRYYALVSRHQQKNIKSIYAQAQIKIKTLSDGDTKLVPSHNDLVLENILIGDSGQIWIIDWEYASMASPWWDLATLCNASELSCEESANLLKIYRGEASKTALRLLADYRYVLQVLSICWMAAFTETDIGRQIVILSNHAECP
jgi:thiamine kinase-like enzyme